ncbi:hypothetical protein AB0G48_18200 [Streptomyces rubiginosohelvolus]|uniref:hypothetical protein n=1 Tax=Streptomyces rubiginosohelvolus TaxID=67362 RepID=UPI0033C8EB85
MTTVHSEPTTERTPGRAWTVRILGHNDRTASVTCTTTACRMPPRSKDLTTLRTFAARHAAAHARAATVRSNAWCHCGSQRCGTHPDSRVHCAGAVVMILRHDPTLGRVWSVEEVCETCAPLIPHTTVLARAARPARTAERPAPAPAPARPGIAGGFSAAPAPAADDAAPARSASRTPQKSRRRRSRQGR